MTFDTSPAHVEVPTWLGWSLPETYARVLRSGHPHRLRLVDRRGDLCVELLILPHDTIPFAAPEPCVSCSAHPCVCTVPLP